MKTGPRPDVEIAWSRQITRISAGQFSLWAIASVLTLGAHAAAGWWVMREPPRLIEADAAPAIMVELAFETMAPESLQENVAADEVDSVAAEEVEAVVPVEPVEPAEAAEAERVEPVAAEDPPPVAEKEVVEAEDAPVDVAVAADVTDPLLPEDTPSALDPELEAVIAEPSHEELAVELPEEVALLPTPRPEKLKVEKKQEPRKQLRKKQPTPQQPAQERRKANATAPVPAPKAVAPAASAGSGRAVSPARWQARLMAHLERRKRYPVEARRARREGEAQVRFTIDASGNVKSVALTRSSGVPELDREVVAMVHRASPVPAPPPGVGHTIVVPVRFNLR